MNSFTEFACLERWTFYNACLERWTFYNFVSVTKGRLTNRFFHAKRLLDSRGEDALKNQ